MASWLVYECSFRIELSRLEPWPGTLRCILGQDNNNNNNNELYLHDHKRDLQHCKSTLTITITKSKSNNNIKLSIVNCLAFLNRILSIVLTSKINARGGVALRRGGMPSMAEKKYS